MRGIILAGGSGTRLYPCTHVISKQLLPIYDKPLIYYPLSTLMLAGIRTVLIISTPHDTPRIKELLGDGTQLGMELSYAVQDSPRGLADAFIVGREFISNNSVCLVLGDNIFYGSNFQQLLERAKNNRTGATVFGYRVVDPERFGVVDFDNNFNVLSIEEKPTVPKSNWAVVGLYFYDNTVLDIAANLLPSDRGELEITDVNNKFLKEGNLKAVPIGRGFAWLDTGTPSALLEAGNYVRIIEERQGFKISCIEEVAYRMEYISLDQLISLGKSQEKSEYGQYILRIATEESS
ncbi:glucose-1-phosphate thymidylyltransferase RfbA [Gemmatimonadota bacterium]